MKKRLTALLMALAMIMCLMTAAAAEDGSGEENSGTTVAVADGKVVIGEKNYSLRFGDQFKNCNTFTAAVFDSTQITQFQGYVWLLDDQNADASEAEYCAFWNACSNITVTVSDQASSSVVIENLSTASDGYHKYFPISVTGACSGEVALSAHIHSGTGFWHTNIAVTQATKIELDANGSGSFQINGATPQAFYIDLPAESAVRVSASLGDDVRGRIDMEGASNSLWSFMTDATEVYSTTQSAVTKRIVLTAYTFEAGPYTGNVSVTVEQPRLMWRETGYDGSVNTQQPLREISDLPLSLGNVIQARFYYGTPADYASVTGTLTSGSPDVISVSSMTAQDGNTYYQLSAVGFGTAAMTIGKHSFHITVGLPYYGFYSSQTRSEETCLTSANWYDLPKDDSSNAIVWLLTESGFTEAEQSGISVMMGETAAQTEWVLRDGETDKYDLKILLPRSTLLDSGGWFYLSASYPDRFHKYITVTASASIAAYVDDLVIGFTQVSADGAVTRIMENGAAYNTNTSNIYQQMGIEPGYAQWAIGVAAARKSQDSTGATVYTVDEGVTASLQIEKMWVEALSGPSDSYSWSSSTLVPELTNPGTTETLYARNGVASQAILYAQVSGTVNGQPFSETIQGGLLRKLVSPLNLNRPDNDTVEALNLDLAEAVASISASQDVAGTIVGVYLGNTTYNGTIVIPAGIAGKGTVHLYGASGSGNTVLIGGIDLNGTLVETVSRIHFAAPESGTDTKAIFNGGVRYLRNCSFFGYDIALDSSNGLINAYRENVFVNNETAAYVNIGDHAALTTHHDWKNNTFINNGTAVSVLSLNQVTSPYYFRIFDSNFINNGTDFDVGCGGTLYMQRNYFGRYLEADGHRPTPGKSQTDRHNDRNGLRLNTVLAAVTHTKLNAVLEYRQPVITAVNDTAVITNPRYKSPVKRWWKHTGLPVEDCFWGPAQNAAPGTMSAEAEDEYKDILAPDWELATQITNENAGDMIMDASAFTEDGEKEIRVVTQVDSLEEMLGVWSFNGGEE